MIYVPLILYYACSIFGVIVITSCCINNCINNYKQMHQQQLYQQPQEQSHPNPYQNIQQPTMQYLEIAPKYEEIDKNVYDKPPNYDDNIRNYGSVPTI